VGKSARLQSRGGPAPLPATRRCGDLDRAANPVQLPVLAMGWQDGSTIAGFLSQTLSTSLFNKKAEQFFVVNPFENLWVMPALRSWRSCKSSWITLQEFRNCVNAQGSGWQLRADLYRYRTEASNFYTISALIAADRCLMPVSSRDSFSRQGALMPAQGAGKIF